MIVVQFDELFSSFSIKMQANGKKMEKELNRKVSLR